MSAESATPSPFRSDVLRGHSVLVTGGGSGIGFTIAQQMARHGAGVVLMGRTAAKLEKAVAVLRGEGLRAEAVSGDVRKAEDGERAVQKAVDTYGSLSVLVNSAAGNFLCLAEDLSTKGFRTVVDIDTVGTFNMCKAAFPALKDSKSSLIINISATLQYTSSPYTMHAAAAKAAIDAMTRTLAVEWGEYGIRTAGIAPGPIGDTEGMDRLAPKGMVPKEAYSRIPIGRWGKRDEIALMAVYLATPAAALVTGETIVMDGGAWLYTAPQIPKDVYRKMIKGKKPKSRSKL